MGRPWTYGVMKVPHTAVTPDVIPWARICQAWILSQAQDDGSWLA